MKKLILILILLLTGVIAGKAGFGSFAFAQADYTALEVSIDKVLEAYQDSATECLELTKDGLCSKATTTEFVKYFFLDTETTGSETVGNYEELIDQRLDNQQTFKTGTNSYLTRIYPQAVFAGESNLYKIISATTTIDNYNKVRDTLTISKLWREFLGKPSYAAISTSTGSIQATSDSGTPTANSNDANTETVVSQNEYHYRSYARFTTPASPGSSTIATATLSYYSNSAYPTRPDVRTWDLHTLTRNNWVENQVSWNNYSTGNAWSTAGGDFNAPIIDSITGDWSGWARKDWILKGTGSDNPITITWATQYDFMWRIGDENHTYNAGGNLCTIGATTCNSISVPATIWPYFQIEYTLDEQQGTSTATSTVGQCDMTAGALDNDILESFLLYWFYVVLCLVILTIGYWLVDKFFHRVSK